MKIAAVGGAALLAAAFYTHYEMRRSRRLTNAAVESSRPTKLEIRIREKDAGMVIGRKGSNIREIERKTDTKIHFKDELSTEEERVISICGAFEDIQLAEILIRQCIANQPRLETLQLHVPDAAVGRIIGSGGESIGKMQNIAKCKIDVEDFIGQLRTYA